MSETKPRIFATCKAGCQWETVHKSDFEKSASHIIQYPQEDGTYLLEIGKEYKIFAPKTADGSAFDCLLQVVETADFIATIDTPRNDEYADCFVFKLLEYKTSELVLVYEYNGVRYSLDVSETTLTGSTPAEYRVSGATRVLMHNADAEIVLKMDGELSGGVPIWQTSAKLADCEYDGLNGVYWLDASTIKNVAEREIQKDDMIWDLYGSYAFVYGIDGNRIAFENYAKIDGGGAGTPIEIVHTTGNSRDKVMSQAAVTKELGKIYYVTPEMFGAAGDARTDDTVAIRTAIQTREPCVLKGQYRITSPIFLDTDHQILTIDGTLIVEGEVGLIISGGYITVDGGGAIWVNGTNNTAIRRLVNNQYISCGVEISVKNIISKHINGEGESEVICMNNNTAIEITGDENFGGACFDRFASDITYFRKAIWAHVSDGQNAKTWYTAARIEGNIIACVQAVVIDDVIMGDNFVISGDVQPIYTNDLSIYTDNDSFAVPCDEDGRVTLPLIRLGNFGNITSMIWDTHLMANKYAVELLGDRCHIEYQLDRKYVKMKPTQESHAFFREDVPYTNMAVPIGAFGRRARYTNNNTNDVLLNALKSNNVTVSLYDGGVAYQDWTKLSYQWSREFNTWFDGTNTNRGLASGNATEYNIKFEFTNPIFFSGFMLYGVTLPEKVQVFVNGNDTPLFEREKGVDYTSNMQWSYDYDANDIQENIHNKIINEIIVKFTLKKNTTYEISRISAFDLCADMMRQTGGVMDGDLQFAEGKGVVLTSGTGNNYITHRLEADAKGIMLRHKEPWNASGYVDKTYRCDFDENGMVFDNDLQFASGKGVVLKDSSGVRYRLTVGTDGVLSATKL